MNAITKKIKEVGLSMLPILAIVLALFFTSPNFADNYNVLISFVVGLAIVAVGIIMFLLGVDQSVTKMSEVLGKSLTKTKKIWMVLGLSFVFGFVLTLAEPDLQVLGQQVHALSPTITPIILLVVIATGIGVYMVLYMLHALLKIKLKYIFLVSYLLIFALAAVVQIVNPHFLGIAFDAGGVTTGPITVPFFLALGVSIASMKGGNNRTEDNFGVLAFVAIGPIVAALIFGLVFKVDPSAVVDYAFPVENFFDVLLLSLKDAAISILPLIGLFLLFQIGKSRLPKKVLIRTLLGSITVFIGLVLFLCGVNFGFSSAAFFLGAETASTTFWWILIPVGLLIGIATVYTEPAIIVLGEQVQTITNGQIKKRMLINLLAVTMGIGIMLSVIKVVFEINMLWFLGPGCAIALILMFFTPDTFTHLAFDSGSVSSGSITTAFSVPLLLGICSTIPTADPLLHALGAVGIVTMMPLIVLQVLGIIFKVKQNKVLRSEQSKLAAAVEVVTDDVVAPEEVSPVTIIEEDKDFSGLK